jgi:hypothetical protein
MTTVASSIPTARPCPRHTAARLAAKNAARSVSGMLVLALGLTGAACTGSVGDGKTGSPGGMGAEPSVPGNGTPGNGTPGNGTPGNGSPGTMGNPPGPGGNNPPAEAVPAQPGHTPLRRLTRSQYKNTIQDLLGITGDPAGEIGADETDSGFASNGRAPLKELQLEKYQQVAESLAERAVANLGNVMPCPAGTAEAACVDQFIRTFGKRAYRRPLSDAEVGRYQALFQTGRTGGDLASGVSLVISGILQSPFFLYRVELGEGTANNDGLGLSGYEIGTRLSFFLTDSTPDDALLGAADSGKLRTPEGIAAEAQRLLGSPKARNSLVSFFEQWLQVDDLLTVEKDAKVYPVFTPEIRAAMRDEVLENIDQFARLGDGKLETLLTTRSTWLRGPLYPIYGLGTVGVAGGSILRKVDLPADQRAGLFTTAGFLSKFGHADQSSPVGRGYLIAQALLCAEPPPPPPGVDANVPAADPSVPTRIRFEQHRKDPACASCHALMDPLGVPFEIYDGIGRYRTVDGGKPVDARSELKGTKASDGPVTNALDLVRKLATAEETRSCFAKQMVRYAFGRAEGAREAPIVTEGVGALSRTGKVIDLMVAIATSPGFRTRIPVDLK